MVYTPEKLTAGSTVQLVLNYCQTNLDLFIESLYLHKTAYILRRISGVFLGILKFRKFLWIYCTISRATPNDVLLKLVRETLV
jgi:hypothetical protein